MPSNKERKGKWQAFDALEGYREALSDTERRLNRKAKPQLFPDAAEEIDQVLKQACDNKNNALIKYHENGYTHDVSGVITRVDMVEKTLTINNRTIKLHSIIHINILEH